MSEQETRIPPQAIEVEEGVLGACLMDAEALEIVIGKIGAKTEVFYKSAHDLIYRAIFERNKKGESVDLLSIESYLRDRNQLAPAGGQGYLSELSRSVFSPASAATHCDILLEKYVKRMLILDSQNVMSMAYDTSTSADEVLKTAMSSSDKAAKNLYKSESNDVSSMMQEVMDDIQYRRENPGISGVPSGMPIDKYTGGWQPSTVYIIAARPSIGKTAFALKAGFNAALFASEKYRTNVFYWNGEMDNKDIIKRRLAVEAKVNYTKMRDGKVNDTEMKRLVEAAGWLYRSNMIIDDTAGIDVYEFIARFKLAVRKDNVGLGIVDYLQLMSGRQEGNREQEIASISRGLKAASKETGVPILALSQLSRECERRPGAEPFLSDLRESGSLEQDADAVIMLNRPEFFGHAEFKNRPTKGKGIVKVEKMRNGMTGEFWMNFEKQYADWQPEHGDRAEYASSPADVGVAMPRAPIPDDLFDEQESPF